MLNVVVLNILSTSCKFVVVYIVLYSTSEPRPHLLLAPVSHPAHTANASFRILCFNEAKSELVEIKLGSSQ